jgi:hypothetical protein
LLTGGHGGCDLLGKLFSQRLDSMIIMKSARRAVLVFLGIFFLALSLSGCGDKSVSPQDVRLKALEVERAALDVDIAAYLAVSPPQRKPEARQALSMRIDSFWDKVRNTCPGSNYEKVAGMFRVKMEGQ